MANLPIFEVMSEKVHAL